MNAQEATQEYRMNEWIKIVRECRSSGENVTSWCKNNNIRPNRYYYWLRKIRTAASKSLPSTNSQEQIVPIDMSSESLSKSMDSAYISSETARADIVIRIGSAVLEIHNSASITLIENTIRVLQNVR